MSSWWSLLLGGGYIQIVQQPKTLKLFLQMEMKGGSLNHFPILGKSNLMQMYGDSQGDFAFNSIM